MMQILNIASYKFVPLVELPELKKQLLEQCGKLGLKGTILLSEEGINLNLAGRYHDINSFQQFLQQDIRFADLTYRESHSDAQPFARMKVKIKKEIITLRRDDIHPEKERAPSISPQEFKKWLDENREITILDTRNDYEVRFGTFRGAVNLFIDDFCQFPKAAETINRDKPVVMFCTGGIRCEKAALELLNSGFPEVYQLHGGILNYFAEVGGVHYDGECFVFDQRVALDHNLQATGTAQCTQCNGPKKHAVGVPCSDCMKSLI